MEGYVRLWKQAIGASPDRNDSDLTRSKIKFNHLIFTKLSKKAFTILLKTIGNLIFRNKNEMLYSDKASISKFFYIVVFGGFSLYNKDDEAFGQSMTQGFTIGEEVMF